MLIKKEEIEMFEALKYLKSIEWNRIDTGIELRDGIQSYHIYRCSTCGLRKTNGHDVNCSLLKSISELELIKEFFNSHKCDITDLNPPDALIELIYAP